MAEDDDRDIDIHVPVLARVEGEGAMHVVVDGGAVTDVRLEIYEPPRFFEALLRGRHYDEPVDITARICGICPVAYQMSACHALERSCGVTVDGPLRDLRRLLYCGEWIASHVLHIAFLHAPDFLGVPSGLDLGPDHTGLVRRILELKKAGNRVMEVVGGRAIHPVNVRLGGFHRAPTPAELAELVPPLERARATAVELVRWTAGFDVPDVTMDHELVSLRGPGEYPFNEGRIVSDRGLDIDAAEFEAWSSEAQVAHSTALHSHPAGGGSYHVGPLARWANNRDLLPATIRDLAAEVGCDRVIVNPFRSIVIRSLETLFAVDEALRLIDGYLRPVEPAAFQVPIVAGEGWAATEAPRGLLYHRYRIDAAGRIEAAQIVPPTAQNLPAIEADLRRVVTQHLDLEHDELRHRCEQAIRNYDPCISCATHFLRLTVEHVGAP